MEYGTLSQKFIPVGWPRFRIVVDVKAYKRSDLQIDKLEIANRNQPKAITQLFIYVVFALFLLIFFLLALSLLPALLDIIPFSPLQIYIQGCLFRQLKKVKHCGKFCL